MLFGVLPQLAFSGNELDAYSDCKRGLSSVDPFIGSGGLAYGYGSINPGVTFPRGALRLGPDTTTRNANLNFEHFSGYNYEDKEIRMFSHTHFVGAGIAGAGAVGIMPGIVNTEYGLENRGLEHLNGRSVLAYAAWRAQGSWHSGFSKDSEHASPGQYAVYLDKPEVRVDLVATSGFSAVHKYTFPMQRSPRGHKRGAFINACHAVHIESELPPSDSNCGGASIEFYEDGSFRAKVFDKKNKYTTYLRGELLTKDERGSVSSFAVPAEVLACANGADKNTLKCSSHGTASSENGVVVGQFLFDEEVQEIWVRVGISFVDWAQASVNLQTSGSYETLSFDRIVENTEKVWCNALSYLDVTTSNQDLLKVLYSASYRTRLTPAVYSEQGGVYLGFDGDLHNVNDERAQYKGNDSEPQGRFYSDFSLWDTFRTQNPWLFLTDESAFLGILRSFGEITEQQGAFPKWTTASEDNSCMMGLAGAAGVLEAALAGYDQADLNMEVIQKSLQEIATSSNVPLNARIDLEHYLEYGYVSSEAAEKGSSYTVTYAYDDFLLSEISALVGKTNDSRSALERSRRWRTIFSAEDSIICPRAARDGSMSCPTKPQEDFKHYTEGNALHWTYFVPHDIPGLIAMHDPTNLTTARSIFEERLDYFFTEHIRFAELYGNLVPNPYFWAGNEPTMLTPYLYSYLGTPSACAKTQRWTREIIQMHFSNATSAGIPGNDDYAAMAAWTLWSSLGVFPLSGSNLFFLTSPVVEKATIALSNEAKLTVITNNQSPENMYISKLLVNGLPYTEPFIEREVLVAGVTLEYFLSRDPITSLC